MSMRIDSCKPFYFICDVENLTLAQAQTVFPNATKVQYVGYNATNYGTRFYLVWAGYEVYISGHAVLGDTFRAFANHPVSNSVLQITSGLTIPTDRVRFIADFTSASSAKSNDDDDLKIELEK